MNLILDMQFKKSEFTLITKGEKSSDLETTLYIYQKYILR